MLLLVLLVWLSIRGLPQFEFPLPNFGRSSVRVDLLCFDFLSFVGLVSSQFFEFGHNCIFRRCHNLYTLRCKRLDNFLQRISQGGPGEIFHRLFFQKFLVLSSLKIPYLHYQYRTPIHESLAK